MIGLSAYEKVRSRGETYEETLKAALEEVRQIFPEMRMSETEMKRPLAEFRPKGPELNVSHYRER
jgi:hypothetical protein